MAQPSFINVSEDPLHRDVNSPKSRRAGFLPLKPWRNPLAAQEPYRSILRLSPFGCICVKFLTSLFQFLY
jgi:hypothetical protein